MSDIQSFDVHGSGWRFGVADDGRSFAVAADLAKTFEYRDARDALRAVDDDEKGTQIVRTPGGPQEMLVVYKDGIWELIFRSSKAEAKAIKKRVKAILNEIEETGRYEVATTDELELAQRNVQLAERNVVLIKEKRALASRAEKAEGFKRAIEAGDGLQLRAFHKKYFSTTPERAFFDHLYTRGLLINQRGKGPAHPRTGEPTDGRQHRHPTFKSKEWLYLHAEVDRNGKRQENTRVRPGDPELAFRDKLASQGLVPNEEPTALFELEVVA